VLTLIKRLRQSTHAVSDVDRATLCDLVEAGEKIIAAYDVCDSNRGAFSCTEWHDTRCPKSRADSAEKWKGKWICECGREQFDVALAAYQAVVARLDGGT